MKIKLLIALCALACASVCVRPAEAQVYSGTALQNSGGNIARIVPFAPVTVCVASDTAVPCTQKAAIFTDETLGTQCTATGGNGAPLSGTGCNNPGLADANGNFTLFATPGVYRICTFAQNYQCVKVSTGGSGSSSFVCGTTPNVAGLFYWNGTACVSDNGATFDPVAIQWNFEAIAVSGTASAAKFSTTGAGGVLEMKAQAPPTPGATLFDVYIDNSTGLLGCRNSSAASCLATLQTIASGTAALPTSAITSGGCASTGAITATGVLSTDTISATANVDPTGVSGYGPSASGSLYVQAFPAANTVTFKVCNNTSGTITPAALSLNWAVRR